MNLRPVIVFAKSTLIIALALIVMAGATGLSFKAHYCHNKLSGIAFYTELGLQKPASCGCKEDLSKNKRNPFSPAPLSLSKNGCCANVSFFSKLNLETTHCVYSSSPIVQPEISIVFSQKDLLLAGNNELFPLSFAESPPPPISGRKLVLFLCQQRIPSISYNC
ncbi:MAG: hypothetical protein ACOYN4_00200 [Bacteroidales bacterium]